MLICIPSQASSIVTCMEVKVFTDQASVRNTLQHISRPMAWQAGEQILESRVLHLPMAFDDERTRECISMYMRSARQEAPYLPSNIDFVAKNNGDAHSVTSELDNHHDARPFASAWLTHMC